MTNSNELIPAFCESLLESKSVMADALLDFGETTIDSIIESDIIDSIPILKLLNAVVKTGIGIRERKMMKHTLAFLQQYNSHTISDDEYQRYIEKYSETKHTQKEIERVLLLIDRQVDIDKSEILANLYVNYIKGNIEWLEFVELSDILDGMLYSDIIAIKSRLEGGSLRWCTERLLALGLMRIKNRSLDDLTFKGNVTEYEESPLMSFFIKYGIISE